MIRVCLQASGAGASIISFQGVRYLRHRVRDRLMDLRQRTFSSSPHPSRFKSSVPGACPDPGGHH